MREYHINRRYINRSIPIVDIAAVYTIDGENSVVELKDGEEIFVMKSVETVLSELKGLGVDLNRLRLYEIFGRRGRQS